MDMNRFRLRRFLDELAAAGELETHAGEVALADVAKILQDSDKAVLFEQNGAESQRLVGNVMSSRRRMALAFGVEPRDLLKEIRKRLAMRPEVVEVARAQAPVQEVVMTGADVDLYQLPLHVQHGKDGGPYLSAGLDFAHDESSGWTNVGLRRFMLRSRNTMGIDLLAPSDLRAMFLAKLQKGQKLPLSVVVGAHPIDYFAGTMRLPVDELGLISSLRGGALPVVKGVTNDIRTPADAEWVLEGYLGAEGYKEAEGPYGEFLGYYGALKMNPIFYVEAVTRRRDAAFQTITISGPTMARTDTAQLSTLRTEALVWRALEGAVREPVSVYVPPATGGVFNVRVGVRQRVPGEARNAIAAVFACQANCKNVFVVDPDVDVFSDEQMEWALATRFQPHRDLVVAEGFRTLPLDPSLDEGVRTGSKAGYDLTLPFGHNQRLESEVPFPPTFAGARFKSVREALQDGPKYFEELMAAVGSRDGRDVMRAIDELRAAGQIRRDPALGKYMLEG
jgi:2,5-furandicarboxylate decarboxylase 1